MTLSHFDIKNAQPAEKPYKLTDGGGLHLFVQPNGSRLWRMRYEFLGKEHLLSFGAYPTISLAEAREKRDEAKKLIAAGTDPSVKKKLDRIKAEVTAGNTFGLIAAEYIGNLEKTNAAPATIKKNRWFLEELAKPIANRPIAEITAAELLHLLQRIEKGGRRETARRMRGTIGSVFRLAVVTLRASHDPTVALQGALLRPNTKPRAAIVDEKALGGLMRNIDEFPAGRLCARRCSFARSLSPDLVRFVALLDPKWISRRRCGKYRLTERKCGVFTK